MPATVEAPLGPEPEHRCPTCGQARHPRPWARQEPQDGAEADRLGNLAAELFALPLGVLRALRGQELDVDQLQQDGAQESPPRLAPDPFYPTGTDW